MPWGPFYGEGERRLPKMGLLVKSAVADLSPTSEFTVLVALYCLPLEQSPLEQSPPETEPSSCVPPFSGMTGTRQWKNCSSDKFRQT